jgi:hypothetical protein
MLQTSIYYVIQIWWQLPESGNMNEALNCQYGKLGQYTCPKYLPLTVLMLLICNNNKLPIAAAQFRSQIRSFGIHGRKCDSDARILRVFRFPLPILIPPPLPSLVFLSSTLYSLVTGKVKLSLCLTNRSTFSWPRHYLEVTGQLHAPTALPPRKEPPVPSG